MISEKLRARCFDEGYPDRLRNSLLLWLMENHKLLNTGPRVATFRNRETKFLLEEQF